MGLADPQPSDRGVAAARAAPDARPPSPEDVLRLLRLAATFDPELATFVQLAASTGARRGELHGFVVRSTLATYVTVAQNRRRSVHLRPITSLRRQWFLKLQAHAAFDRLSGAHITRRCEHPSLAARARIPRVGGSNQVDRAVILNSTCG